MLDVENLHVYYGGVHALKGVSFCVPDGKVVALLGANGAGKSTTLRAICGLVAPQEGTILIDGKDVGALQTFERVRAGTALVPEGRQVFTNLTVLENLSMGAYARAKDADIATDMESIFCLFPVLKERLSQKAGTLSGGEQQMLAVARALMSKPRLLLMDEPSLGLASVLVTQLFDVIKRINDVGTTVLLVEQNARAALRVADYGYVLEVGRISLEGGAADLASNEGVRRAYIGG